MKYSGKVALGETERDALDRELAEELGLAAGRPELSGLAAKVVTYEATAGLPGA